MFTPANYLHITHDGFSALWYLLSSKLTLGNQACRCASMSRKWGPAVPSGPGRRAWPKPEYLLSLVYGTTLYNLPSEEKWTLVGLL